MKAGSIVDERFTILPQRQTPNGMAVTYWKAIADADLLKLRMCDCQDPDIDDVVSMLARHPDTVYYIIDLSQDMIAGEFIITPVVGKIGTVHFSSNPKIPFKLSVALGAWCTDKVLNEWRVRDTSDEPYLTSLVGLTPALNRRACLYVIKTGFKRVMEIPNGCHHEGVLSPALMTIKYRKSQLTG